MKPGSCAFPYYGIEFAIVDPLSGAELQGNGVEGVLCIKKPWPAIGENYAFSMQWSMWVCNFSASPLFRLLILLFLASFACSAHCVR